MEVAVRYYSKKKEEKKRGKYFRRDPNLNKIFVFDTETTVDTKQNLKIGYFMYIENGVIEDDAIFYNKNNISKKELETIREFCKKNKIYCIPVNEFIELFYDCVYYQEAICLGFNLPFDISRLAIRPTKARNLHNAFSFLLDESEKYPRVKVKHRSKTYSLIQFSEGVNYDGSKRYFNGHFLDLKTLAHALTERSHSLESACNHFDTDIKKSKAAHGKQITEDYIKYCINDVKATYSLYLKLKEEYEKYNLDTPMTRITSTAALGKSVLRKLGIKTFSKKQEDFSPEILGYIMSSYYGGRCEIKMRKIPVKISVLDFTSMYPSVYTLLGMDDFLTCKEIKHIEDTDNIIKLVDSIQNPEDIRNKDLWKYFTCIVQIIPKGDMLPTRAKFSGENIYNIGICEVSSKERIWYSLPDIIASKLLTGKTPKIMRAIRFIPSGTQKNLQKAKIYGVNIDPSIDKIFKKLVEKRSEIKKEKESTDDLQRKNFLEGQQKAIKCICNSSAYGIYIEHNIKHRKCDLDVYCLTKLEEKVKKYEKPGEFFNPIIGVTVTAASRLMLATIEALLKREGATHFYMDTDSAFVPSKYSDMLVDFFQHLSPYRSIPLLKKERENVWFYGISSKRYVLYKRHGDNIKIVKNSEHGLGHILAPNGKKKKWYKEWWKDILNLHYGLTTRQELFNKYTGLYALSRLTVTSPSILKWFDEYNKNKSLKDHIKPYNFFLIGQSNFNNVKPIAPSCKNSQSVVYRPFINSKTCEKLSGTKYWKQLYDVFFNYLDHPDTTSANGGDVGEMKKRNVDITNIVYVGKEAINIENVGIIDEAEYNEHIDLKSVEKGILKLKPKDVKCVKMDSSTLNHIKKQIKKGKFNPNKNTKEKIRKLKELGVV